MIYEKDRALTYLCGGRFLLSLSVFAPASDVPRQHHLYISIDGSIDDIRTAVKSLGRNDILMTEGEAEMPLLQTWIFTFIFGSVFAGIAWIVLEVTYSALCRTFKISQP